MQSLAKTLNSSVCSNWAPSFTASPPCHTWILMLKGDQVRIWKSDRHQLEGIWESTESRSPLMEEEAIEDRGMVVTLIQLQVLIICNSRAERPSQRLISTFLCLWEEPLLSNSILMRGWFLLDASTTGCWPKVVQLELLMTHPLQSHAGIVIYSLISTF